MDRNPYKNMPQFEKLSMLLLTSASVLPNTDFFFAVHNFLADLGFQGQSSADELLKKCQNKAKEIYGDNYLNRFTQSAPIVIYSLTHTCEQISEHLSSQNVKKLADLFEDAVRKNLPYGDKLADKVNEAMAKEAFA